MCAQLVSTDGSSISDSKSQGAGDSVHDLDVTAEKTPMQQTQPTSAAARCVEAAAQLLLPRAVSDVAFSDSYVHFALMLLGGHEEGKLAYSIISL